MNFKMKKLISYLLLLMVFSCRGKGKNERGGFNGEDQVETPTPGPAGTHTVSFEVTRTQKDSSESDDDFKVDFVLNCSEIHYEFSYPQEKPAATGPKNATGCKLNIKKFYATYEDKSKELEPDPKTSTFTSQGSSDKYDLVLSDKKYLEIIVKVTGLHDSFGEMTSTVQVDMETKLIEGDPPPPPPPHTGTVKVAGTTPIYVTSRYEVKPSTDGIKCVAAISGPCLQGCEGSTKMEVLFEGTLTVNGVNHSFSEKRSISPGKNVLVAATIHGDEDCSLLKKASGNYTVKVTNELNGVFESKGKILTKSSN